MEEVPVNMMGMESINLIGAYRMIEPGAPSSRLDIQVYKD